MGDTCCKKESKKMDETKDKMEIFKLLYWDKNSILHIWDVSEYEILVALNNQMFGEDIMFIDRLDYYNSSERSIKNCIFICNIQMLPTKHDPEDFEYHLLKRNFIVGDESYIDLNESRFLNFLKGNKIDHIKNLVQSHSWEFPKDMDESKKKEVIEAWRKNNKIS